MRSQPIASRAVKPWCFIMYSAASVPDRPRPDPQCTAMPPGSPLSHRQELDHHVDGRRGTLLPAQVNHSDARRLEALAVVDRHAAPHHRPYVELCQDVRAVRHAEVAVREAAVCAMRVLQQRPARQVARPLHQHQLARHHLVQVAIERAAQVIVLFCVEAVGTNVHPPFPSPLRTHQAPEVVLNLELKAGTVLTSDDILRDRGSIPDPNQTR
jgi:hypothetical protein